MPCCIAPAVARARRISGQVGREMRVFRHEFGHFRDSSANRQSARCSHVRRKRARRPPRCGLRQMRRRLRRGMPSASRQAVRRSSLSTPTGAAPITSRGPLTGNAAIGKPLASASSSTRPKVSVLLGKTKTSRRHRSRRVPRRAARRETPRAGYFRSSAVRAGPSPTISLVPGRSRSRKASRFFSTATRPTQRYTGAGRQRSIWRG